jgi:Tol biopolymer transport system component
MSPDGLDLYMASNRPGSDSGKLDIWVAHRARTTDGWGAPERLPAPVNTAVDEFCPTPARGHRLFFVSRRDDPNGDIYVTRRTRHGWETPQRLGPAINSSAQEWSPSYFELENGTPVLYFSSTRNGNQDIYVSTNWGQALPVSELNTGFDDARPNVRHDGKEIVFDSTRPHTEGGAAVNPDIWTAVRTSPDGKWSAPRPIDGVNSPAGESRASLSWDGSYMLFGSSRPGEGVPPTTDIYVSHRTRQTGADRDGDGVKDHGKGKS